MSILIKGMEMPKSCCECMLAKLSPTGETLICNYNLSTVPWDEKPFDCPLVPVPPHGRLIDADELHKLFIKKGKEFKGIGGAMLAAAWCIANAPTIIPAQTEKEGQ